LLQARTRIFYSLGGGVYAVKEAAYAIFILLFYTQVLGMSGSVAGVIIAISLAWDAVSDPLVGSWSDRARSRYGRRHPFMVYSTLPLAVGFIGLFSPPAVVVDSGFLLACWLLFWSLWVRTFTTAFAIPHVSLSAELSRDYHERSLLMAMRLGILFLVVLLLPAAGFVFAFGAEEGVDGRFVAQNYPRYGIMSACLVVLFGFLTIMGTRRHTSRPDNRGEKFALPTLRDFRSDVVDTFRNRAFRTVVSYDIASAINWGSTITLNVLVGTYVFEFDSDQMALMMAVPGVAAVGLVWLLLKPLSRRWQKPQLLRLALWGMLINSLWLLPLKLAGWLPDNDSPVILYLNLVHSVLFTFCFLLRITCSMSIVADITDQHELERGERKEGGFFSVVNFVSKLSSLVGPLYGGIVLDVIGLTRQDMPGEVAPEVLAGLMYALLLISIPTMVIALHFAYKVEFSQEQLKNIQAALGQSK
jgi:GPH family glycoside/pentoside/hexuronide:cation symporter